MRNGKSISPQAKEAVRAAMKERGEITAEQAAELIRPCFIHDPEKSFETELRRKVNRVMASFKDANGSRSCFSDNSGLYINVDTTANLPAMQKVRRQLRKKYTGAKKSFKKVKRREKSLIEGQIALSDLAGNSAVKAASDNK